MLCDQRHHVAQRGSWRKFLKEINAQRMCVIDLQGVELGLGRKDRMQFTLFV